MKTKYLAAVSALLLAGCVYSETPYGRYAAIDLPVESRTTINKTVTINAPPGTTVVYGDATPASAYQAVTTVITTGATAAAAIRATIRRRDRCTAWKAKAAA